MNESIDRESLKAVIRRAAELYAAETEAKETLSETEVLRIGTELGLPERLVRQALYEMPGSQARPGWLHRLFGPGTVTAYRVVPGSDERAFADLDEYLVAREFLQCRRRKGTTAWYEPAADAISNMARAFQRPASRYHIARATRVIVATHALDQDSAHVRLTLDLSERQRNARVGGLVGGIAAGSTAGVGVALVVGAILPPTLDVLGLVPAIAAGATTFAGVAASITVATARSFRRKLERARVEVEGLLDRLERCGQLEPPAAPWWRRFQRQHVPRLGDTRRHR